MARRKGKSSRRIGGWERRFRESPDSLDTDSSQTLQPRRVKLPPSHLRGGGAVPDTRASADDAAVGQGLSGADSLAIVMGLFPGGAIVRLGGREMLCRLAGTFRAPKASSALAVGDEVSVVSTSARHVSGDIQADKERADGVIMARQPRRSVLSRPQPTSGKRRRRYGAEVPEKVIVANMDVLLIVASLSQPPLRPGMIDRFCILAQRGDMQPVVVLSKMDLLDPSAGTPHDDFLSELSAGGLQLLRCSAKTGMGLGELLEAIRGRSSVLAGASGVGKSTLINALVPGANMAVGKIRMKDQRGRHVTSAATLHRLPGGGVLVDTPGVRELAVGIGVADLTWCFPELAAIAGQCKFNDCTHTHEPDCAVRAAVEDGTIRPCRYRSYLRILETIPPK